MYRSCQWEGCGVRRAVHKTTCGVDNHRRFTGALYWETWSWQLEGGGSLEISSSQKLYDMIRLTGVGGSPRIDILVLFRGDAVWILYKVLCKRSTLNLFSNLSVNVEMHERCFICRLMDFVPNQRDSVKPSKYCYSACALNNPINPNAFETSTTGWPCQCQAQFKGYSEPNTHLCESEILQLQQMASIRCSF